MIIRRILLAVTLSYLILLIPDSFEAPAPDLNREAFAWNKDTYWNLLEERFRKTKHMTCDSLSPEISRRLNELDSLNAKIKTSSPSEPKFVFESSLKSLFEIAPLIAACPESFTDYQLAVERLTRATKRASQRMDLTDPTVRQLLYQTLYGSRICTEEILLQINPENVSPLQRRFDEPSSTPSVTLQGVTIHSGDILVSRGGAPTSALIARGNDFPGNFSHVALVHINEQSQEVSIIESHIEAGVKIATIDEYLADKKLRILALRLRSDLPEIASDPQLPHRAATLALQRAQTTHTAYDFAMDFSEDKKLFCSEVASSVYRKQGIELWMGISHMSTLGVRLWLSAFGVKYFETQAPSDLEYDPQLAVIAEWRNSDALYQDHLDNALIDAMLERADKGERLSHHWYFLPLARIAKGYSTLLNLFDAAGPIPEGMSATAALTNYRFSAWHKRAKERLIKSAAEFKSQNAYTPPYWELVNLARAELGAQ